METRAHHLLIGSFVLLLIGFGIGFAIWLARIDVDRESKTYDVLFTEAVSGLSRGGAVSFKGVPVGEVKRISIDPDNPERIRVRIEIDALVPVTQDTVAVLEPQGLTGVTFVQLDGGSSESPPLKTKEGEDVPVIRSRPSAIQEVFSGAPDLLRDATVAVGRIGKLLNEQNQQQVAEILANVNAFTSGLANSTDEMERIVANLDETMADFRSAAQAINRLSGSAETLLDKDARHLLADARSSLGSIEKLSDALRKTVEDNRGNINQFTATALPEATRLMSELRRFAQAATAVAERLEEEPGSLLNAKRVPEYEGKK